MTRLIDLKFTGAEPPRVTVDLEQSAAIVFEPDARIELLAEADGAVVHACDLSAAGISPAWLPRGRYRIGCHLHAVDLPVGRYVLSMTVTAKSAGARQTIAQDRVAFTNDAPRTAQGLASPAWSLESAAGTVAVEDLAWNRGHENWFFRHFDHAALVVTDYLLDGNPLLRGRILDVGCGDGITDLGIFLRYQPEEMVGIDPFSGFDRLGKIVTDNHLPRDVLEDPRLRFASEDGNRIPYPDDYFDVVVSWGSLEHIAGGYAGTLREIRRVLKNDGLFFVHPGLFYGALGNHLGEFFDDPFIHLKLPEAELRDAVLNTRPELIDRAGHDAEPAQYWQWYTELNPIRVADFERELRNLGFEPWRVALRSSDIIEYSAELQSYSMLDLATAELYLSCWNRKG
ncbi:MAG: class I SAM-dependent methyltransferase [Xanthomonadales bacterium]